MKETMKQAEKLEKILNWAMGVSVALLGISSAILSIAGLAGLSLPDILTRVLGVVSLLSLPVLVYSTVKKALNAKEAAKLPVKTAASAEKKPNLGATAAKGVGKSKKKRKK